MTRRTSAPPSPAPETTVAGVIEKVRAATARVRDLRRRATAAERESAEAWRATQALQVREAVARTELTLALQEALQARARVEAQLRVQALAAYVAARRAQARPLRRHNRPSRHLDRLMARVGGGGLVAARAGLPADGGPMFDAAWYLRTYDDVDRAGLPPLTHYLLAGAREGRNPHPLFDQGWYRLSHAHEIEAHGLSPLEHYVRVGAARGTSPHPIFDPGHYLAQAPDVAAGEDALAHYLRVGWRAGLSPHPLFDPEWYASQGGETAEAPLLHYVTEGWRAGLSPHPLFDPAWYLDRRPDAKAAGVEPLGHFLMVGGLEGANPGPWFDLPAYAAARGDDRPADLNPLVDYVQGGAWAVGEARPGFPTAAYLANHAGSVRDGFTPLEHWARRPRP